MLLKDTRIINTLRTAYLDGEITEDYLRNLLDKNLITLEEFTAITEPEEN